MKTLPLLLALSLLAACSALPSMQYCDEVHYDRTGNKIKLNAECSAPIGTQIPRV